MAAENVRLLQAAQASLHPGPRHGRPAPGSVPGAEPSIGSRTPPQSSESSHAKSPPTAGTPVPPKILNVRVDVSCSVAPTTFISSSLSELGSALPEDPTRSRGSLRAVIHGGRVHTITPPFPVATERRDYNAGLSQPLVRAVGSPVVAALCRRRGRTWMPQKGLSRIKDSSSSFFSFLRTWGLGVLAFLLLNRVPPMSPGFGCGSAALCLCLRTRSLKRKARPAYQAGRALCVRLMLVVFRRRELFLPRSIVCLAPVSSACDRS